MTHSSLMATSSPAAMSVPWQRKKSIALVTVRPHPAHCYSTRKRGTVGLFPEGPNDGRAPLPVVRWCQWSTKPRAQLSVFSLFKTGIFDIPSATSARAHSDHVTRTQREASAVLSAASHLFRSEPSIHPGGRPQSDSCSWDTFCGVPFSPRCRCLDRPFSRGRAGILPNSHLASVHPAKVHSRSHVPTVRALLQQAQLPQGSS